MIQCVVVFRVINHLTGQVLALLDAIATYIDWDNYERLPDLAQVAVARKEPTDCHIGRALPVELACSEAFTILENSGDLVVSDDLLHQRAIDKAALHWLSLLSATTDVTSLSKDLLHDQDLGDILVVAKCETTRNSLRLIDVDHDEKVDEGFV